MIEKKSKKIFKIAMVHNSYKVLNGWKAKNEAVYETLTNDEKKRVNEIMLRELQERLPSERMSFNRIIKQVKPITDKQMDDISDFQLMQLLRKNFEDLI